MAGVPTDLQGAAVVGPDGQPLGIVTELYADKLTGRWEWVLVAPTGSDDERDRRLAPLAEATVDEAAGPAAVVRLPYDAELLRSAPDVGGAGHLNVDAEAQFYLHYGLDPAEHGSAPGTRTGGTPTGIPPVSPEPTASLVDDA